MYGWVVHGGLAEERQEVAGQGLLIPDWSCCQVNKGAMVTSFHLHHQPAHQAAHNHPTTDRIFHDRHCLS